MFEGLKKLFTGGGTAASQATPAQNLDSSLRPPFNLKPWEDRSFPPAERLQAYKDFVREKVEGILAAVDRLGGDAWRTLEIRDAPETQRWMEEARWVQGASAEDLCHRMDYRPEVRALLGNNFLGSDAWRSQGIGVGVEPIIPASITKELLQSECPLHPGAMIKDSHLLVLIPKTVDGEPYTGLKLDQLCDTMKGSGVRPISTAWTSWKKYPWASAPQSESEWVLIPVSDPHPGHVPPERHFRSKKMSDQRRVRDAHYSMYREARTVELMTAAVLYNIFNKERLLPEFIRCQEQSRGAGKICVGYFDVRGLLNSDGIDRHGHSRVGRALVRNL